MLLNNKLNRFVNLIRKSKDDDMIDQIAFEIDQMRLDQIEKAKESLLFVEKDKNPEVTAKLKKLYEEYKLHD